MPLVITSFSEVKNGGYFRVVREKLIVLPEITKRLGSRLRRKTEFKCFPCSLPRSEHPGCLPSFFAEQSSLRVSSDSCFSEATSREGEGLELIFLHMQLEF